MRDENKNHDASGGPLTACNGAMKQPRPALMAAGLSHIAVFPTAAAAAGRGTAAAAHA